MRNHRVLTYLHTFAPKTARPNHLIQVNRLQFGMFTITGIHQTVVLAIHTISRNQQDEEKMNTSIHSFYKIFNVQKSVSNLKITGPNNPAGNNGLSFAQKGAFV